jgi:heptosyltransferase-1
MSPLPQRILIIRLSAIGDIIMASGLIPALRGLYPEAYIAWLAEDAQAELLRHNPRLDRVHLLPRQHWRSLRKSGDHLALTRDIRRFIASLRAEQFDLVIDLQGLLKSGIWSRLSGARRRIGLGSREGSQWLMTEVIPREIDDPRIGKEYRDLAVRLGAPEVSFVMDIVVPDEARHRASRLLEQAGLRGNHLVLAPFTTRPQKHWFDDRWAELARRISPRFRPVMLGGPGDRERATRISEMADGAFINLVGETSLTECAAIIDQARLLVGVDTGLTHLGLAMNTPTLALFGSTAPYLDTTRENSRVLYIHHECSPCHRRPTCGGEFTCMQAHTVESVLESVFRIIPAS